MTRTNVEKAKGIAFQSTESNVGVGGGEEVDLHTFDNEAIRLEEQIKMQP